MVKHSSKLDLKDGLLHSDKFCYICEKTIKADEYFYYDSETMACWHAENCHGVRASRLFAATKEGQKFDQEKTRWDLLPWDSTEAVAEVLTYGAKKYAPNNWQIVPDGVDRYFAACIRHLVAWRKGEKVDKESGLRHLAHAACCLMFLLHLDK